MKGERIMFKIAPKVYSSMFSLPTEIADKGLKFASGEQLKVIIAIFRNPDTGEEEISKIMKAYEFAEKALNLLKTSPNSDLEKRAKNIIAAAKLKYILELSSPNLAPKTMAAIPNAP